MRVINRHTRLLAASAERAGALIDAIASPDNGIWPARCWPPMRLDRPLAIGARGGHGPIRYHVEAYQPGCHVRFRFEAPSGFDGFHALHVEPLGTDTCELVHELRMQTRGRARLSWPLLYRPLHDALIEDAFACAQAALGDTPRVHPWSRRVRVLRAVLGAGRASAQSTLLPVPVGTVAAPGDSRSSRPFAESISS